LHCIDFLKKSITNLFYFISQTSSITRNSLCRTYMKTWSCFCAVCSMFTGQHALCTKVEYDEWSTKFHNTQHFFFHASSVKDCEC
jgi:hypothetical protein